jgi:hypothetical protein
LLFVRFYDLHDHLAFHCLLLSPLSCCLLLFLATITDNKQRYLLIATCYLLITNCYLLIANC